MVFVPIIFKLYQTFAKPKNCFTGKKHILKSKDTSVILQTVFLKFVDILCKTPFTHVLPHLNFISRHDMVWHCLLSNCLSYIFCAILSFSISSVKWSFSCNIAVLLPYFFLRQSAAIILIDSLFCSKIVARSVYLSASSFPVIYKLHETPTVT